MYGIKLVPGLSMSLNKPGIVKTIYAEVYWEDEDGTKTTAATCRGYLAEKHPKAAEKWARKEGIEKKAEYSAYFRKHGERKEVVLRREREAKKAEQQRISAIQNRCARKYREILDALAGTDLGKHLETGQ